MWFWPIHLELVFAWLLIFCALDLSYLSGAVAGVNELTSTCSRQYSYVSG